MTRELKTTKVRIGPVGTEDKRTELARAGSLPSSSVTRQLTLV